MDNQLDSRKLNIVVAHYLPNIISGAENSIADFVDQADSRFQFTMLVPGEGNLADFYRKRGFRVWVKFIDTPRRIMPGLHTVQSWLLARELRARKIDAVLCNTFPAASRVGDACRFAGIPFAIYMRDYLPDNPVNRRVLSKANALFAISKDVIKQHARMADLQRFRLTYNYINPEAILARDAAHRASGQRLLPFTPVHPVVGLVGRLTRYKQPDLFLRAIPHILQEVPDARFVLVGAAQDREKEYEQQLCQLASTLDIQEKVAFLGQRRDVIELTSEFTVACLASGREPLGRVVLEANLIGVPVVVPNIGGPAEIVEDEGSGLHFASRAEDADEQLAHQVIRLLKDPGLRTCLAKKGRERVLNTFASRRPIQVQEEYIEQLCAARE